MIAKILAWLLVVKKKHTDTIQLQVLLVFNHSAPILVNRSLDTFLLVYYLHMWATDWEFQATSEVDDEQFAFISLFISLTRYLSRLISYFQRHVETWEQ